MRLKVSNVCQLLDKSKYPETQTIDGVTFMNNGDGTITANGTSTKNYASYNIIKTPRPPIGHKILVLPENNYNTQNHIFIWGGTDDGIYRDDLGYAGSILTITGIGTSLKRSYTTISISLNVNKGWVMNNHIYKPQLFDLTEMYGAGNEPTTIEQFRADFPNEMYEYSPVCWKKFRRLKYINAENSYLTLNRGKYIANKEPVQLLNKSEFRETFVNNGITYTNNGNGTFTLNGTTTSESRWSIYPSDSKANIIKANHKYLMLGFPIALNGNNYGYFQYYPFNTSIKYYLLNNANGYLFFTPMDDGYRWNIFLSFKTTGFTVNNITIKPQLFDLTEMYGEGNEPTTIEQFRADFPNALYDYNPYNAITFR